MPIKAIIDLTNTNKYYNSNDWGHEINYNKINVPGQEIPTNVEEIVEKIDDLVMELEQKYS